MKLSVIRIPKVKVIKWNFSPYIGFLITNFVIIKWKINWTKNDIDVVIAAAIYPYLRTSKKSKEALIIAEIIVSNEIYLVF